MWAIPKILSHIMVISKDSRDFLSFQWFYDIFIILVVLGSIVNVF